jgi:hypothetical protein
MTGNPTSACSETESASLSTYNLRRQYSTGSCRLAAEGQRYASSVKALLVILLTLIGSTASLAQSNKSGTFKFEKRQGTHKASVIFQSRAFAPSKHKVTKARDNQTIVDGRLAHGTDGNVPNMEISSIKLFLDGTEVSIPRKLYSDCFEPNLDDGSLTIRFGRDFQTVIITMWGSDGAGGYEVVWRFRKNGYASRSFRQGF